jgi:hypothetical protein
MSQSAAGLQVWQSPRRRLCMWLQRHNTESISLCPRSNIVYVLTLRNESGWRVAGENKSIFIPLPHANSGLRDLRFSKRCCWRLKSSGMLRCVVGQTGSYISKDCCAFLFKVKQSKTGKFRVVKLQGNEPNQRARFNIFNVTKAEVRILKRRIGVGEVTLS